MNDYYDHVWNWLKIRWRHIFNVINVNFHEVKAVRFISSGLNFDGKIGKIGKFWEIFKLSAEAE